MSDLILKIIALELESINLKKKLIKKYSGNDDAVSQIIAKEARCSIRQSQESIQFFSKL